MWRRPTGPGKKGAQKKLRWGPCYRELSYLDEILLFLFSTGDGLFDRFCFSQDSLSFVQFVATLSVRHFLINSRRQSVGKVRQRPGKGCSSPGEKHRPTVFRPHEKGPLGSAHLPSPAPDYRRRHRRSLLNCGVPWCGAAEHHHC